LQGFGNYFLGSSEVADLQFFIDNLFQFGGRWIFIGFGSLYGMQL